MIGRGLRQGQQDSAFFVSEEYLLKHAKSKFARGLNITIGYLQFRHSAVARYVAIERGL
ncbi:MAG TPA: hypothetical protein VLW47_03700 [Thermodesulfobacteriota bacterium]|nr:hypothetical protein [Thermodesulfobacteriota bacterium]